MREAQCNKTAVQVLSRKFVILYKLCEDLLSKSKHYDWKLRAIKTTLYVAGGMKRASPELSEDKVHSSTTATRHESDKLRVVVSQRQHARDRSGGASVVIARSVLRAISQHARV